MIKQVKKII